MYPLSCFVLFFSAWAVAAGSLLRNSSTYLWDLGLPSEEHEVITEDGYILRIFRIPKHGATPVIFMHGFLGTSDMWLLMERDSNLATILADNGYDVWIANMRGNMHSHRHILLSSAPNNFEYWNFSIDEIAKKDLPAIMNHITTNTGKQKMFYIGHSMGSTAFFILCSENPQICEQFHTAVLLAPIAFPPERVRLQTVDAFVQWGSVLADMLRRINVYEFLGSNQPIIRLFQISCASDLFICRAILQLLFGFDKGNSLLHPLSDHVTSSFGGTSVKVFDHISRIIARGTLGPYDSISTPQKIYRSSIEYKLENIEVPIGLVSGADDIFVDEKAMNKLRPKLKKIMFDVVIPGPFKHLGYFYEVKNNYQMVSEILNLLKDFSYRSNSLI
ncbi:gastric triacylglycerol lipase isoform X2 [Halyomorpha halys]|uniref:gastric triacylglycerol lipase isoform X2 n=1 Tax=Halyomorpha halys TaxID=286706 RepID=UPI0006D4DCA7|nr:gastric triacylglycerol lipase-like isoform X2 [Halyomorpha halys]